MSLRRAPHRPRAPAIAPLVVCRWDLDKTYLRSDFDSLRQLLRTAFERPEDKVQVPGVAALIKALKGAAARESRAVQVHFISASPPQIGKAIRAKLDLDGVPYDGIVFKDQLQHLRRGKLRNLREHVGFKLTELLRGRLAAPLESRELLFGDDWESDSLTYSLYADVVSGRLGSERLRAVLRRIPVDPAIVEPILGLAARAARADPVARIFINLERRSPPASFHLFGRRVVPTFNYFQTAAVLAVDGYLGPEDAARVGRVLMDEAGYTPRRLENSLGDLVRRGYLPVAGAETLARRLRADGLLPPAPPGSPWRRALDALGRLRARRTSRRPEAAPEAQHVPDYDAIIERVRGPEANPPVPGR